MKKQYESNKAAKLGEEVKCPTCGEKFVKSKMPRLKVFCKESCKNVFWGRENKSKYQHPERYYPITPNSCRRFLLFDSEVMPLRWWEAYLIGTLKQSIVSDRSISYRMEGVSIGRGYVAWDSPLDWVFILKIEL